MAPAALPASFPPTPIRISPTLSSPHSAVNNLLPFPTASLFLHGYIAGLEHAPLLPLRRSPSCFTRCTTSTSPSISKATSELGLDEREVECLLQKHPELELASPESLHRRLLSLQSVGITGLGLHRTVARRPKTLTSPEVGRFIDFVHKELEGLEPAKLERLLVSSHPQFFPAFSAKVRLLVDHGMPGNKLGQVLNDVNISKVFGARPIEGLERMIVFLKGYGWPELIVRRPSLLNLDLENQLIPRVDYLAEVGAGDREATGLIINKWPAILSCTVEHFRSHIEFWRSIGLADKEVFKIAMVYPQIFSVSKERKLKPRIEFLHQCKMNAEDISKFLIKAPLFVSLSFEYNLSKKLAFLVKIGYRHRTRELALAVGAVTRTSCENLQMVIDLFFSYGFSRENVLTMSMKHPQVLQYNHESMEKKIEFLVEGMGREIGELLIFPAFLGYKLDDRIRHRYEMNKEIRGKGISINKLLSSRSRSS
ncbi:transcription termination factor MTERF8, chloroplastic-like isoform X2 [Phoenix dactylifera]|uniref:Transcription termination factor MTERF8, chloroplastic-like isoform X2 n=1 Tax=Phoenix dactylifera TaxID=42345 RepID=A0A8B8ZPF2_PHODC|nr:transcription termination factor MTERF8, chloroplastic-like isoform X2 [Phoenix dactylifera]